MAREDLRKLYQELISSGFNFMPRGETLIDSIYKGVKSKYPELCDDKFLCSQNCRSGGKDPKWHHVVRKALDRLKRTSKYVEKNKRRGYWIFL